MTYTAFLIGLAFGVIVTEVTVAVVREHERRGAIQRTGRMLREQAYLAFAQELARTMAADSHGEGLSLLLVSVDLFGSRRAAQLAADVVSAVHKDDRAVAAMRGAEFRAQVRRESGVTDD
jgi:hypothetical protein